MYYSTCHRGLHAVVSGSGPQNAGADKGPRAAPRSFSGAAESKPWENSSCVEPIKAGPGRPCHTAR